MNGSRNGSTAPTPLFNQGVVPGGMPGPPGPLKNSRGMPPGSLGCPIGGGPIGAIPGGPASVPLQALHHVSNKFIQVFIFKITVNKFSF